MQWMENNKDERREELEREKKAAQYLHETYGMPNISYLKSKSKGMKASENALLEVGLTFFENHI